MGADCKSAGVRLRRFESFPAHELQHDLHDGDVEPAVELAADLAFDADELEAASLVELT
jgi:hypothetical protein